MFVDCGGKARAECFPLFLRNPTGGLYRLLTTGTSRFLEVPRKVLLPVQVPGKSEVCPCGSLGSSTGERFSHLYNYSRLISQLVVHVKFYQQKQLHFVSPT